MPVERKPSPRRVYLPRWELLVSQCLGKGSAKGTKRRSLASLRTTAAKPVRSQKELRMGVRPESPYQPT